MQDPVTGSAIDRATYPGHQASVLVVPRFEEQPALVLLQPAGLADHCQSLGVEAVIADHGAHHPGLEPDDGPVALVVLARGGGVVGRIVPGIPAQAPAPVEAQVATDLPVAIQRPAGSLQHVGDGLEGSPRRRQQSRPLRSIGGQAAEPIPDHANAGAEGHSHCDDGQTPSLISNLRRRHLQKWVAPGRCAPGSSRRKTWPALLGLLGSPWQTAQEPSRKIRDSMSMEVYSAATVTRSGYA